jgi:hypothetical protein
MTYFVRTFASRPVFRLIVSHCGSRRVACTSRFSSQRSSQRLEWNLTLEVRVSLSPRAAIGPPRRRYGPSRTLERSGRTQHGNGSEAPLARIVTECACGHGSNRVIELAYNVNQANTGDWRGGGRDADPLLAIERRLRDRTGVMAERAATKSRKGGTTAAGSSWIPEDKRLSKVFFKTEICVTYVPSRQTRAPVAVRRRANGAPECV